jgi:hypothetical protein
VESGGNLRREIATKCLPVFVFGRVVNDSISVEVRYLRRSVFRSREFKHNKEREYQISSATWYSLQLSLEK